MKKPSRKPQTKRVLKAFSKHPKTMLQVSKETGVRRANICRFIAVWKKQNRIGIAYFGLCPITKARAGFYTIIQKPIKF